MMFPYISEIVLNFGQYFLAFISYYLSLLWFITVIRSHPISKIFFLIFFTEYRNLRNSGIEFGGVKLSIESFSFMMLQLGNFQSLSRAILDTGVVNDAKFKVSYESSHIAFYNKLEEMMGLFSPNLCGIHVDLMRWKDGRRQNFFYTQAALL